MSAPVISLADVRKAREPKQQKPTPKPRGRRRRQRDPVALMAWHVAYVVHDLASLPEELNYRGIDLASVARAAIEHDVAAEWNGQLLPEIEGAIEQLQRWCAALVEAGGAP
jgi:hypothetical protein